MHVFGRTYLPSFSNYPLKRTFVNGKCELGKSAAKIFQNNFYIDNMLKSQDDENQTIKLINDVRAMGISGIQVNQVSKQQQLSVAVHWRI